MNPDLEFAIECARNAGTILLEHFGSAPELHFKTADHPVSQADLEADSFLRESFAARFPNDAWLSEETGDDLRRLSSSRVWIVDPLDGTREFLLGIPEFSISIALLVGNRPAVAVVYNPATNELFSAECGGGLYRNGHAIPLGCAAEHKPLRISMSRTEWSSGLLNKVDSLGEVWPAGSIAYKLALLAAGEVDLVVSITAKSDWDICAGSLLANEAGAAFTDLAGSPVRFNQNPPAVEGVLSAAPRLHDFVLRWLNKEILSSR